MLGVLYSFRRCPYAMRARLALAYCLKKPSFELREVVLKDKPNALVKISPKATVPVMQLTTGNVIEESLEIMLFALATNPSVEAVLLPKRLKADIFNLINTNDNNDSDSGFKWALDRYKYFDRYAHSQVYYREKGEIFLQQLEARLSIHPYLMGDCMTLADMAIFPFVRQFAHVDKTWFEASPYKALVQWLDRWLTSNLFTSIMTKYPQWTPENEPIYFPAS